MRISGSKGQLRSRQTNLIGRIGFEWLRLWLMLSFGFLVSLALALSLNACGDGDSGSQGQNLAPKLTQTPNRVAGAGPAGVDPYANLTPREVMHKYLDAYSRGDWVTCNALLAPNTLAGLASRDELKLKAEERTKQFGPLTIGQFGEVQGTNTGAEVMFGVDYRRDETKALYTPNPGVGLRGIGPTPTPDSGATATARAASKPDNATFILQRIDGIWKIRQYVPF